MSRAARNRKNNKRNSHAKKDIPKITINAKKTKIINQGRDTDKHNESFKESSEMITNQVYNSGKHNKSLKKSRERGFTDGSKIPKITITAKITKITNLGSDTGKHNKSLKESRERGFTNVTKIPKTTLILDYSSF